MKLFQQFFESSFFFFFNTGMLLLFTTRTYYVVCKFQMNKQILSFLVKKIFNPRISMYFFFLIHYLYKE